MTLGLGSCSLNTSSPAPSTIGFPDFEKLTRHVSSSRPAPFFLQWIFQNFLKIKILFPELPISDNIFMVKMWLVCVVLFVGVVHRCCQGWVGTCWSDQPSCIMYINIYICYKFYCIALIYVRPPLLLLIFMYLLLLPYSKYNLLPLLLWLSFLKVKVIFNAIMIQF